MRLRKEAEQASGRARAALGACVSKHRQHQCCLWGYMCTCGVGDETQTLVQVRQLLHTELYPQHFIVHLKRFMCMNILWACIYMHPKCAWAPERSEEKNRSQQQITELEL